MQSHVVQRDSTGIKWNRVPSTTSRSFFSAYAFKRRGCITFPRPVTLPVKDAGGISTLREKTTQCPFPDPISTETMLSSLPSCDFRFVANMRENISPIRACVADGGGERDFVEGLVQREFRFCCNGNFNDDGGRFNCVKYSLGLFDGELSYFTDQTTLKSEPDSSLRLHFYLPCLQ